MKLFSFLIVSIFTMSAMAANDLTIKPGGSVLVKSDQDTKVSCEGSTSEKWCSCVLQGTNYKSGYYVYSAVLFNSSGTHMLIDKLYSEDCLKFIKSYDGCR